MLLSNGLNIIKGLNLKFKTKKEEYKQAFYAAHVNLLKVQLSNIKYALHANPNTIVVQNAKKKIGIVDTNNNVNNFKRKNEIIS